MGGTFDPIHVGHLVTAEEALHQFALDEVVFVPTGRPWMKEHDVVASAEHRYAMTAIGIEPEPRFHVSRLEVDRGGASYTVDTLRELHDVEPEHDLTFIVGGDMASSLPSWREPEALLELARVAVAEREEHRRQEIAERLDGLGGADERVVFFTMPRLDISSSDIRRRIAERRPIRWLVPGEVCDEIERRGLYGAATGKALA